MFALEPHNFVLMLCVWGTRLEMLKHFFFKYIQQSQQAATFFLVFTLLGSEEACEQGFISGIVTLQVRKLRSVL